MRPLISALGGAGILLIFSGIGNSAARERGRNPLRSVDRLAAEAGFRRLRGTGLVMAAGACALVAFVSLAALTGLLLVATAASVVSAACPFFHARSRRDKQRRELRHEWPEALTSIISGVRAGLSLAECCCALAERGPAHLREGFAAFASTYKATASFVAACRRLQDVLEDPIADRVVAVLRLAHEVGGNDLVRVLRTAADFVRQDLRIRGEIEARWSWTVAAARLAAAAPAAVLCIMSVRPEAAAAYRSGTGSATIFTGIIVSCVGYRLMLRATRLPEDRRVGFGER